MAQNLGHSVFPVWPGLGLKGHFLIRQCAMCSESAVLFWVWGLSGSFADGKGSLLRLYSIGLWVPEYGPGVRAVEVRKGPHVLEPTM